MRISRLRSLRLRQRSVAVLPPTSSLVATTTIAVAVRRRTLTTAGAAAAATATPGINRSGGGGAGGQPPLRVAVIGSGPAGFYTTKYLLKEMESGNTPPLQIDMYDALPTPFGLVRFGVAPDHPEVKSVQNDFSLITQNPAYRFIGNVKIGSDLSLNELRRLYSGVVLAYGAVSDRELGIENEKLNGIHSARAFVNWYNAHPNFASAQFDLTSHDTAVVVGQGNVAIDVARILCSPIDALAKTDIADYALEALSKSRIRRVLVMGRRGPVQTAFTIKELREVTQLAGCTTTINKTDMQNGLNEASLTELKDSRPLSRKVELLKKIADASGSGPVSPDHKHLELGFFYKPEAFKPDPKRPGWVGSAIFERTKLSGPAGDQTVVGTGVRVPFECGLVLRSIGYKSLPIAGVAFDAKRNVIPSTAGRVLTSEGGVDSGLYVSGWLKRGPTGIIASNIIDAKETVSSIIDDARTRKLQPTASASAGATEIDSLLRSRGLQIVDTDGWRRIEAAENAAGQHKGKPREKFVDVNQMLAVAGQTPPPKPAN